MKWFWIVLILLAIVGLLWWWWRSRSALVGSSPGAGAAPSAGDTPGSSVDAAPVGPVGAAGVVAEDPEAPAPNEADPAPGGSLS